MAHDLIIIGSHAQRRMLRHRIEENAVRHILISGEIIEDYPDDERGHSYLVMGSWDGTPMHVVAADKQNYTFVITAYRPNSSQWESDFRTRK
ncbi:MAG: DUF4258 domain-containing protein [Candidatus Poribacteria bacterium]|nr:DUF4258 domain-containing protein [Candidatus Poribacteria bacterium]